MLILFIVLSFVSFILSAYNDTKLNVQSHLREICTQTANTINVKMQDSLEAIRGYARLVDTSIPLDSEELLGRVNDIARNSKFSRIWITDKNGVARSSDGGVSNAAGRGYFTATMRQESGITGVMQSVYNNKNIFIVYAPLMKDRQVVGMIHGTYEVDKLTDTFPLESFAKMGYSYLFEADGGVLLSSQNPNAFHVNDNILDFIEITQVKPKNAYINMLKNTKQGEAGDIQYSKNSKTRYATYVPVGINDWFVLSAIPSKVVEDNIKDIIISAIALTVKITIAFIAMLIAIMWLERKTSKKIAIAYNEISMLNDNLPGGVKKCTADDQCEFMYVSEGFVRMVGYSRDEIKQKFANKFINIVAREDRDKVRKLLSIIPSDKQIIPLEYRILTKMGKIIWVSDKCRIKEEHGKACFYCSITDITTLKAAEQTLHIANEQYRIAATQIESLIFEYDPATGVIIYADENMALRKIPEIIRKIPEDIISTQYIHSEYLDIYIKAYEKIRTGADTVTCEVKAKLNGKGYVWHKLSLISIYNDEHEQIKVIGIMQDIDDEKKKQMELHKKAEYDALTGVFNRLTVTERIDEILESSDTVDIKHALILIDVDYFKQVNDTLGHIRGDEMLQKVANLLKISLRKTDVVGRLGGDEFVAFLNDIETQEKIAIKADELCKSVQSFSAEFDGMKTSMSVGIAVAPQDGESFAALYKKADIALYESKETGKNKFTIYNVAKMD